MVVCSCSQNEAKTLKGILDSDDAVLWQICTKVLSANVFDFLKEIASVRKRVDAGAMKEWLDDHCINLFGHLFTAKAATGVIVFHSSNALQRLLSLQNNLAALWQQDLSNKHWWEDLLLPDKFHLFPWNTGYVCVC